MIGSENKLQQKNLILNEKYMSAQSGNPDKS